MSSTSAESLTVPPGYRMDARSRLVPEAKIKTIDKLRDDVVQLIARKAKLERERLQAFKRDTFSEIESFVELSAQEYGVALGGTKGNVQLLSFDGRYKVLRAVAERIQFDERLQAAKALIDECLRDWSEGSNTNLVAIVQDAFRVDAAGELRIGSILSLRRHDIDDERWKSAMDAINDAVQVVGSKSYVRVYERDARGKYQPISLDIAGV